MEMGPLRSKEYNANPGDGEKETGVKWNVLTARLSIAVIVLNLVLLGLFMAGMAKVNTVAIVGLILLTVVSWFINLRNALALDRYDRAFKKLSAAYERQKYLS